MEENSMFNFMRFISDLIRSLYEWAAEETDKSKKFCKAFIAGFADGWEFGCLVIGNLICFAGLIIMIVKPFLKKNVLED